MIDSLHEEKPQTIQASKGALKSAEPVSREEATEAGTSGRPSCFVIQDHGPRKSPGAFPPVKRKQR